MFKFRLVDHEGYIVNKVESQPAGLHYNLPGHSLGNMTETILKQVKYNNEECSKKKKTILSEN